MPRVVVLTGAGISAESGVPTFRDADGLWEGHRVEDVATPEAFDRRADRWCTASTTPAGPRSPRSSPTPRTTRWPTSSGRSGDDLLVVTQNIDDLHERAGSTRVLHMHGELRSALCRGCGRRTPWADDLVDFPPCPRCGVTELRPDVVWFGEIPYEMERIQDALEEADLFVSIGTSGAVYPAAGFVQYAAGRGARTLELNLIPSAGTAISTRPGTARPGCWCRPGWRRLTRPRDAEATSASRRSASRRPARAAAASRASSW